MKKLVLLIMVILPSFSAFARPRAGGFNVSREGRNGGSVEAEGMQVGRYRSGSVSAEGPKGGTYDASGTRVGRFGTGSVDARGPNGGTVNRSATTWNGYRNGYVYRGGGYHPANVVVNAAYLAPIGIYAGWSVIARPYYITYPVYATYPVQVSVQVELQRQGYYGGPIDGNIGPQTQKAIAKYQSQNGLPANGQINEALLKSLHIM
jgi:hypothetical protein